MKQMKWRHVHHDWSSFCTRTDHDAFLVAYNMVRPTTGHGMCSHLTDLMAAYFAFDINYPVIVPAAGAAPDRVASCLRSQWPVKIM